MLLCLADYRVHAVSEPDKSYPQAVCGVRTVPAIGMPGAISVCCRFLAALPEDAILRPVLATKRLSDEPDHSRYLTACWRCWLTRRYSWRIRRATASRHDAQAATRLFRRPLTGLEDASRVLVTDTLASDGVAHRRLVPGVQHRPPNYPTNRRRELPPTRQREDAMKGFRSAGAPPAVRRRTTMANRFAT
jgi:hypothetical protein